MKKAVIDIDNTLWHFCDVLYKRLKKINKAIPGPAKWVEWDFCQVSIKYQGSDLSIDI